MLRLPPPPEIDERLNDWRMFAMGFSPSTQEYKLFRLSFPRDPEWVDNYYLDVYTLGAGGGWRCWCTPHVPAVPRHGLAAGGGGAR